MGSPVKNIITLLLYAAIAVVIVLLVGFSVVSSNTGQRDMTYPYGQTDTDKAKAMQVAFNDRLINNSVYQAGRYTANVTIGGCFVDSGFIGLDAKLALVDISTVGLFPQTFHALVDITGEHEMEARYPYNVINKHGYVLLPKGVAWYHTLNVSEKPISVSLEFDPQSAKLYPVIVDRPNFERYVAGQDFEPLTYADSPSGDKTTYSGSIPISSLWRTNVTASGISQECYIILKNNGPAQNVMVKLEIKPVE